MLEVNIKPYGGSNQIGIANLLDLVELAKEIYDRAQSVRKRFNLWQAVKAVPLALELVTELSDIETTIKEVTDLNAVEMEQLLNRVSTVFQLENDKVEPFAQTVVFPIINGLISLSTGVFNAVKH